MPAVFPFEAVQFNRGAGDASANIAPPYDVLDARAKAALLARNERNIVSVDLPHVPAKELGPTETYAHAAGLLRRWLTEGYLTRRERPAMFAYRQTFTVHGARERQRCGMACTVPLLPFGPASGGGILPHEETFSGPKEDRMALMKAVKGQTSPIFGLHPDERGAASGLVRSVMASRAPDQTARMADDVRHEVWAIDDAATISAYADALAGEDVFIADGHHRYTTALNYLRGLESQHPLPPNHPAKRCMIVLVGMSDPGLYIGPTHRVLGGMKDYTIEKFIEATKGLLHIVPAVGAPERIEDAMVRETPTGTGGRGGNVLGLIDFASGKAYVATLMARDPLARRFPDKPPAWRDLDVAIVQHAIVEDVCQPKLNAGNPITWAFPHSVPEVLEIGRGRETGAGGGAGFAQLAIIVRPTPLEAVRAVSRAGVLMPQKSTFFYPKLATGLFMHIHD
ncbi:MAG: DUF1015 domain-containing protein [Phycisphaeraceae bacterium]|nr:MAG: DUF1015 domain-containing protein [Phycisphaeraceae bacterium]